MAAERMTTEQLARFQRDGFINAGKILPEETVQELSAELDRVIAIGPNGFKDQAKAPVSFTAMGKGDRPVWQIVDIWMASSAFERLLHHPFISTAIGAMTGSRDLQIWHDQVQYKPARMGGTTAWHQDAPYWPSIEPMTEVSAWIPFDDAEIVNGCMWMVPGSHRWGNQIDYLHRQRDQHAQGKAFTELDPFPVPPEADAALGTITPVPVACPVRKGEIHFHHALTWHGSPHNHSDKPRRAVAIHFMTSQAVYTGRNHLMAKYIRIPPGESMAKAGPEFPFVLKNGEPV
jgi:ectoine hydroxylase-related dioxygenase (phytanoyl-CoA dioxygenase family)